MDSVGVDIRNSDQTNFDILQILASNSQIEPTSRHQQQNLDIVTNLLPYPHILEKIFADLRPKHLRVIPCVARGWRRAIYEYTPNANRRRLKSLKRLRKVKGNVGRENWPIDCECAVYKRKLQIERNSLKTNPNSPNSPSPTPTPTLTISSALSSIQNTLPITRMLTIKKNGSSLQTFSNRHQRYPYQSQSQSQTTTTFSGQIQQQQEESTKDLDYNNNNYFNSNKRRWKLAQAPFKRW